MTSRSSLKPTQALILQVTGKICLFFLKAQLCLCDNQVISFYLIYWPCLCWICSVGIPHKEAAMACCDEVHPLAKVC